MKHKLSILNILFFAVSWVFFSNSCIGAISNNAFILAIEGDTLKDSLVYIGTFNYGLSAVGGKVIGTSSQVPSGTNHYKNGGSGGMYFSYPISKKIYIYLSMGVAERGYLINSKIQNDNTIYYRSDVTNGYRNILYLDKIKCIGLNLTKSFSVYLGAATSIRIRVKTEFNATSYLTPKDPTTHKENVIVYPTYSKIGNDAMDFLDLAVVGGLRWNAFNKFGLSFRYMRDVIGVNTSTENQLKNTLVNSGFYLALDIPLYKNKLFYRYSD